MAAGAAMAADGGTITFKTYFSASNNMKAVLSPAAEVSTAAGWYLTLLDKDLNQVMGTKVGATAVTPVVANFNGASGFVTSGGDWALKGFDQGKAYDFAVAAYQDLSNAGFSKNTYWGASSMQNVMLGGPDLVPPGPAGPFAFGGAQSFVVTVPEPSVLALGLLGMGAFLIRRRS